MKNPKTTFAGLLTGLASLASAKYPDHKEVFGTLTAVGILLVGTLAEDANKKE